MKKWHLWLGCLLLVSAASMGCDDDVATCNPKCTDGKICINNECVDPSAKTCDPECTDGKICKEGECVDVGEKACDPECTDGKICKEGECVNPSEICDPECTDGKVCVRGTCVISNPNVCDPACTDGKICKDRICVDPNACDPECTDGKVCKKGTCVDPNACDPECIDGNICKEGTCIDPTKICDPECTDGNVCINNKCVDPTKVCDPVCTDGNVCINNECVDPTKVCDPECTDGNVCVNNECVDPTKVCDPKCTNDNICVNNACVDPTKICDPECTDGNICINNECINPNADKCDPECTDGNICIKGECVDPSTICDPECTDGNVCINNRCIDPSTICEPECTEGKICKDNECVDKPCETPCEAYQTCVQGECVDNPCEPACEYDQICTKGACESVDCSLYAETCGNGEIGVCEKCDGALLNEETCTTVLGERFEGELGCSNTCDFDTTKCTLINFCGNNKIDYDEKCDGTELNKQSCATVLGEDYEGTISCTNECQFDTSNCKPKVVAPPTCGNGQWDKGEVCDGNQLNCETCESLLGEEYSGTLKCNDICMGFDTTQCFKMSESDLAYLYGAGYCSEELPLTVSEDGTLEQTNNAILLAKSLDICMDVVTADSNQPGIIEAYIRQANNDGLSIDPSQANILPSMRNNEGVVRIASHAGQDFVLLSTGYARDALGGADSMYSVDSLGVIPTLYYNAHGGILQSHEACNQVSSYIYDTVHFHVQLRAPNIAKGLQFDYRFFSHEYPQYVCSQFNDFFLVLLTDKNGIPIVDSDKDGDLTDEDANITYDASGNPISVNNATFTTCTAPACNGNFAGNQGEDGCPANLTCNADQCGVCGNGSTELDAYLSNDFRAEYGEGFGGGTAWLTTKAPVQPGEIFNLDFYIWDTGDSGFDSSVILDNFKWLSTYTEVSTGIVCEKQ